MATTGAANEVSDLRPRGAHQVGRHTQSARCSVYSVLYTMAKFAVQGRAAEAIYDSMGKTPKECTSSENVSVSLSSGVIAGVVAAIISHPADTLLSKVNKAGAGGEGSIMTRLGRIAAETGVVKLCTQGLAARCVMIGTLTAGQFGIFDSVMEALGASKFHFHNPAAGH